MKTLVKAVFIFAVLLIAGVIVKNTGNINLVPDKTPVVNSPVVQDSETLCFIWNTEAGDSAKLKFTTTGEDVVGDLRWLPWQKDSKTGSFVGKVSDQNPETMVRTINAWWQVSAEGMNTTEELEIIFGDGIANVGFGEMKDRGDGTYVYADPVLITWEPNLSQTDCADEAMR